MTAHTPMERTAVRADAEQRLAELRAAREALIGDADDPHALSELTAIESALAAAERECQRRVLPPHQHPRPKGTR